MTNPKGRYQESLVVKWLIFRGWLYAKRIRQKGALDEGDIHLGDGVPVVIESKNTKSFDLAGSVKETEAEIINAGAEFGYAILKRRGTTDVGQYYAVTTVERMDWLLQQVYEQPKVVPSRRRIKRSTAHT